PTSHSPARDLTTTPLQQLFVLNSAFVEAQAAAITTDLSDGSIDDRITIVYQLLFQRPPSDDERRIGTSFLAAATPERWQSYVKSLLGLNEFLFVD
ncbi:MAG: DUF1553 domain-containing protein, partial [Candidatus Saccharimonas sp.]|nr:DUF1553 domain-containing protein [Planctomycetaceae bacterium]